MCIIRIPETKCLDYMKQVLTSEAFEAFIHGSIFDKAVFCLGEKQGILVNDERSSWYNKVGDFLMSVWNRRKETLYGNGSIGEVGQTTPLQSAWSMALGAMTVDYE